MADSSGSAFNGGYGDQSAVGSSISGDDGVIRIDPGAIDANADASGNARPGYGPNGRKLNRDGSERAPRGSGGRNTPRTAAPQAPLSVDALTFSIVGIHALLSATLHIPELALEKQEGEALAKALANLQRFYNIQVTEKALAWSNLAMTLATVYGTRIGAVAARRAADRRKPPQSATILRPDFQRTATPPLTPSGFSATSPDGDPATAAPVGPSMPVSNAAEQAFQNTPADLM